MIYEKGVQPKASPLGQNPVGTQSLVEDAYSSGTNVAVGLPTDRKIQSTSASLGTYILLPYNQKNVIEFSTATNAVPVSYTIHVPTKRYDAIGLLVLAVDGDASFTLKLEYDDGTTDENWFEADDWYDLGPRGNLRKVVRNMDRVEASSGKVEKSGHFNLYEFIFDSLRGLNTEKKLTAITISNDPNRWPDSANRWGCVFAVNGSSIE